MKALVIGGGGREHALVSKLSLSRHIDKIYCCPGNAGISALAECIDINPADFKSLLDFVRYEWIDFTVVGPEEPLSKGIVDAFEKEGLKIVGPCKKAAQLESSKVFAKDFMRRYRIPTPEYSAFSSYIHAVEHIRMKGVPIVIKADGLAAGKGVFVTQTMDEAIEALRLIMKEKAFGDAGNRVVVEECITGEEASFMAFCDGETILSMPTSQDHKRVFDDDLGPNTGGMGAYSPAPVITKEMEALVMETIMRPVLKGLKSEGIKYKGVLYAGLMITADNAPQVLEFNCRFGDPETQPVLARLETDIADIFLDIISGKLSDTDIIWRPEPSVCVVLTSKGYPGKYEKGDIIKGIETLKDSGKVSVFHSGTAFDDNNNIVTAGGRVLGVTALGKTIKEARDEVYKAIKEIHFDGMHYRKDIAARALKRQ